MNNLKALILGILILVPILILAFVGVFGEHHFSLPTFYPKLDASGEVQYTPEGDTVFHQVPDFSLVSQEGNPTTSAALKGDVYVAYFFPSNCPANCKKVSSQLVRIQEAFETKPEVKIVSITAAPEADSADTVQGYATKYGAKEDKWYVLTGEMEEVEKLAREGYFLSEQEEGQQGFASSGRLVLVDKEGRIRGLYDGTDQGDVDRLRTEINVLLDDYSKRK